MNTAIILFTICVMLGDYSRKKSFNQLALILGLSAILVIVNIYITTTVLTLIIATIVLRVSYMTTLRSTKGCKR